MPVRPVNLATMSATIAGACGTSGTGDATTRSAAVTFESGYRQVVAGGGCRLLACGQGGVVGVDADTSVRYALFAGTACQGGRVVASGNGPAGFDAPVLAGAIVVG